MNNMRARHMRLSRALLVLLVALALLVSLVINFLIGAEGGAEKLPIAGFIVVSAVTGSAVNQPFRGDAADKASAQQHPLLYFLWKCSVAIVFAFVLYFTVMAGLLSGDMFPQFRCVDAAADPDDCCSRYTNMVTFIVKTDPRTNRDVAKLLVWSFVAGYSERFVPNLIARLGQRGDGPGR